jgi:hypothetical protein
MKRPPADVQFHEDIRLLVWRPGGVLDEAAINKVLGCLEDLEGKLQAPFNRLPDTLAADEVNSISNTLFRFLSIGASLTQGTHR